MKKIIFLLICVLPLALFAQRGKGSSRMQDKRVEEKNLKYYKEVFGTVEKDFNITKAPAEWSDEPVVVLCQKIHIAFLRNTSEGMNQTKGVTRKRILIQDKAALEDFSEFYYQTSEAIGINLIKPNGKKTKIDLAKAVKVETDIPSFYRDNYHSEAYYKIAIPNLEVGDILDYFKVFKETYRSNIELIAPITYSYPVVSQEIIFDVDKLWTFYYNSFNNAPKFKQDPEGGIDINGRKRKIVKRFVLKTDKLEAQEDERWTYTYLTEPIIKIMAVPPNGFYADKSDPIKTELDLKTQFRKSVETSTGMMMESVRSRLNSIEFDVDKMSKAKKVDMIYRVIRYDFLQQAAMPYPPVLNHVVDVSENYYLMRGDYFASLFSRMLDKHDIASDLVLIIPRYFGSADEVITEDEMAFGVYVPATKKYYWPVDNFQVPGESPSKVFGATGYKLPAKDLKKRSPSSFKSVTIPVSNATDNVSSTYMDVTLKADNSLHFKNTLKFTGTFKPSYSPLLLFNTPYYDDEADYMYTARERRLIKNKKDALKKNKSKKGLEKAAKAKKEKEEKKKNKKEVIENWIKDDYEVEEFIGFKNVSSGITSKDNVLEFQCEFTSKDYIQKAGPNIIFDLGRLIGSQVELKEDEIKERTKRVEVNYAKTFENEFKITLPEGLTAQGLENLNMNVDNPDGAFISSVKQEGNVLFVKTSKVYKNQTVPVANWQNMVDMLEAAYTFTQQKVILK